ncbi:Methyltransferase [Aspergillus sp. HF37]|nr:Methyltransferase [Aspergillus sp. HF37]
MADSEPSHQATPPPPKAAGQSSQDPTLEIVPDDDPHSGEDPAFLTDSDAASSTQSLTSSVMNYQYENGRRYHAYREGEYMMPNDDQEQDRLDLHHHIFRLAIGGALFRAPVDVTNARILDLGTGTGIWPIEVADEYPSATVTGTDLSPIQPRWVPPNCFFEVDDYESPWEFSKPFDFIHARSLAGAVRDFPRFCARIKNNLKPGGWVEFVDFPAELFSDDESRQNAPNISEWCKLLDDASQKFGKDLNVTSKYKQWLIDAGFRNVKEDVYKIPVNPWAKDRKMKEIGRYQQVNMVEGMEAYSMALFTRVLGMTSEEVQVFFAGVRQELVDRSLHLYAKFYYVYGEKVE